MTIPDSAEHRQCRKRLDRGLVIAAGYGYPAPATTAALLAAAGLVVLTLSVLLERWTGRARA